jgi:hypothetical protein
MAAGGKVRAFFDHLLFGGTRKLRPYENACIEGWRETLSPEGAAVLSRQFLRFNLIQRSPDEKLVSFFDTRDKSYATWGSEDLFPLRLEEISAARIWLRSTEKQGRPEIKADVVLHKGRLSSIEFNLAPQSLRTGVQVTKVKTLIDPMRESESGAPISLAEVPGELGEWLTRMAATGLRQPLSPPRREELAQTIDARLPDEYNKLASVTDGATIEGWRISGLSEIRRIVQPTDNYYLLAEATDGRAIAVIQGSDDAKLYVVSPEDDKAKTAGQSMLALIERDLAQNRIS